MSWAASLGTTHSPASDLPDQRSGGVTIKGRHPDGSSADTPGPGAYDVSPTRTGGFSMAGRYPDHKGDGGPGPGAYAHQWLTPYVTSNTCRSHPVSGIVRLFFDVQSASFGALFVPFNISVHGGMQCYSVDWQALVALTSLSSAVAGLPSRGGIQSPAVVKSLALGHTTLWNNQRLSYAGMEDFQTGM